MLRMLAYQAVVFVFLQFCLLDGISAGDLQVKLAIFSGRPDPKWSVLSSDPKLTEIQKLLDTARKGGLAYAHGNMPARLGYKGILVQFNGMWQLILGPKTVQLQLLLFQSMPKSMLSKRVYTRTEKAISLGNVLPDLTSKTARKKRFAPPFDIAPWMDDAVKENNNCYNYANIKITNTFAQPGRGSTGIYAAMTAAAVRTASVNDGLQVVANGNFPAGSRHVVALVVEDGEDFHWYRRDRDGKWSHKPGETSVTRKDDSGNLINDPQNCDMGDYEFVCYMTADRNTVTIN